MRPGGRFVYRLALALGKSLAEVEHGMSGHELDRWKEFHALEPLPDPAWNAAQICAVVANSNRTKGRPSKISDFLPRVAEVASRVRLSGEELMRRFRSITKDCK